MITILILALILIILSAVLAFRSYRIHFYAWYVNFPRPKYRVVFEKNFMVAMPDGTRLATDIYRPKSLDRFPVLIIRTPYNKASKQAYKYLALLFASRGYVIVVQDVRGKYGSEGKFYPYAYEALDGHTTVTWAGEARWSNGKVALFGISYSGSCAWLAARYKSPYLRTIISMFTTQDTYSIWVDRGIPFLKGPLFWLSRHGGKTENTDITGKSLEPALWKLPVNELDIEASQHKILFYRDFLAHTQPDSFWEEISGNHHIGNLDIPVYIVGGWYDPFLRGTIDDYQRMKKAPHGSLNHHSRLTIGPWSHNPSQKFKGMELGKYSSFQALLNSVLDWCDVWLKDRNETIRHNNVRYFIMGKNTWEESEYWPPSNVKEEKLFLSMESGSLNCKDGLLLPEPSSHTQKNHFKYNPRDPVLFRGSSFLQEDGWLAPIDQEEIVAQDDVMIYNTSVLQDDYLCVAGAIKLILYVSSQAVDTDFCAKICNIYPSGKTIGLTPGFVRMRFRESLKHPELIAPGSIYKVEISFRPIAHAFLKGHRIQLQITSSDFPVHDRNLNTGLNCESSIEIKEAEQTIYTGKSYESHLILPVLKD